MRATAKVKNDGRLTRESFDFLLARLGDGIESAGVRYERLRGRLVLYFLHRMLPAPEDLADEVLDRLARRLAEGEKIASVEAYAVGIARHVAYEQAAATAREVSPGKNFWENVSDLRNTEGEGEVDHGLRLDAMEGCLAAMPQEDIELLKAYYLAEGKRRIETRRNLAVRNGMNAAGLRKKIFLLCSGLRSCIRARTERQAVQPFKGSKGTWGTEGR